MRQVSLAPGARIGRIVVRATLLALLLAGGLGLPWATSPAGNGVVPVAIAAGQDCADAQERAFLRQINKYRRQRKLPPLALDSSLMLAAHKHSQDMTQMRRVRGHDLLGGVTAQQNLLNHGYPANQVAWGENLAYGTRWNTGVEAFKAWRGSPGHNRNMLRKQFRAIGIARVYDPTSTYKWYWTTTFGGAVITRPSC